MTFLRYWLRKDIRRLDQRKFILFWTQDYNETINNTSIIESRYDENKAYMIFKNWTSKNEEVIGLFSQVVQEASTDNSVYVLDYYHSVWNLNNYEKDNVNYFGDNFMEELSGNEIASLNNLIPADK